MKSVKYKIHKMSKRKYPTHVVMSSTNKGHLIIGRKEARQDLERRLNRSLHKDTIESDTRFQWEFKEPLKNES